MLLPCKPNRYAEEIPPAIQANNKPVLPAAITPAIFTY